DQNGSRAVRMGAFNVGLHQLGDLSRVFTVGPRVDDGIVGIVVNVGVGGEDPVHAQRAGLARGLGAFITDGGGVARRAKGHVGGPWNGAVDAHGRATFEVRAHQQRN